MIYLMMVSLIWAFSFGLIKGTLSDLDPTVVAFFRMALSFLVFIPFVKRHEYSPRLRLQLVTIGAVQFGLMYICYIYSYQFLKAFEVALFTIFTPLYVTLIGDLARRNISAINLVAAAMTVLGTGVIVYNDLSSSAVFVGFVLVQCSNLCFAIGQIWYRNLMRGHQNLKDLHIFGLLYFGALLITGMCASYSITFHLPHLTLKHLGVLSYLGIVASGLCFFLWNVGARITSVGSLAVMNNVKIPLAVTVSLLVFGEKTDLKELLLGGAIIVAALFLSKSSGARDKEQGEADDHHP